MQQSPRKMVFVAMPFGKKRDTRTNVEIDFDAIYKKGIQPAVAGLNVDLIRADEERGGGIVHLPMFERLLVAEIAIVDVTIENANVFYELGVRHTAKPRSTIVMRASGAQMPFDIKLIRAVTYSLKNGALTAAAAKRLSQDLATRLKDAIAEVDGRDSPLFQLIPQYEGIRELKHADTENFRDRAKKVNEIRDRLLIARRLPKDEALPLIRAIDEGLGPVDSANAESAVDVMLSYRDVEGWPDMIALIERFPPALRSENQIVREQHALALNRRNQGGDRQRAMDILAAIVKERGDSPETCSLIGRIYKDRYEEALIAGDAFAAGGSLAAAIDWYRRGFFADLRDYYPGINLATLLAVESSAKSQAELPQVVAALTLALGRLHAISSQDYWTLATLVELSVLAGDWEMVMAAMGKLGDTGPTLQQLTTTRRNLRLIARATTKQIDAGQLAKLIDAFTARIDKLDPPALSNPAPRT